MPQTTKEEKSVYWAEYYAANKEKLLKKNKEYYAKTISEAKRETKRKKMRERYEANKEEIKLRAKKSREKRIKENPSLKEKEREWSRAWEKKQNPEKLKQRRKAYYQANKSIIKKRTNEWRRNNKRYITPIQIIAHRCRATIQSIIRRKGWKKICKTNEMLGCNWETLKLHLENQFPKGMSWDNRDKWHIDHYHPLADAKSIEDVIRLNHYTNLRPMWAKANQKKRDSLCTKGHQIPLLLQ